MPLPPKPPFQTRRLLKGAAPLAAALGIAIATFVAVRPIGLSGREPEPTPVLAEPVARPFPSVELEGASAIVVDLSTGQTLFERDADTPRPLASITKLVTALVASERLSPDARITIATQTQTEEGPTIVLPPTPMLDASGTPVVDEDGEPKFYEAQVVPGTPIVHRVPVVARVDDAIDYALVASSNEAAAALAGQLGQATFVGLMNEAATRAGARTMTFENASGLDVAGRASALGSARDVAALLGYLAAESPELLAPTARPFVTIQTDRGPLTARNTNEIVGQLPNLVGGKTGLETSAGGNLGVVIDPGLNQPIAIVVLGSTKAGRFADVTTLADATRAHLAGEEYPSTATSSAAR
jgi:D-alanyl-D-alanine carboxypeptidase (penicillin-binding protein 5/6)